MELNVYVLVQFLILAQLDFINVKKARFLKNVKQNNYVVKLLKFA